jgi:hypothetical protein
MEDAQKIAREITIGRHKYNHLKSLENPSEEDKNLIELYETKGKVSKDSAISIKEYSKKVYSQEEETRASISIEWLKPYFKNEYKNHYDREFIFSNDSSINLKTVMYYFCKDQRFLKSPNIVKSITIGGSKKELEPSIEKGLLIIGNFGNGKSSTLKTLSKILFQVPEHGFKFRTANDLVREYKFLETPKEKKEFYDKLIKPKRLLIDDAGTEDDAFNFGKANIFKDVLESRADKRLTTHLIKNYKKGHNGDVNQSVAELGERYGSKVLDRIFGNYNIVEFHGKSMRI